MNGPFDSPEWAAADLPHVFQTGKTNIFRALAITELNSIAKRTGNPGKSGMPAGPRRVLTVRETNLHCCGMW
jgi:hypothetical protein